MATLMAFEAYLRYSRQQFSPAEMRAVRAWFGNSDNESRALRWMRRYAELPAHEKGIAGKKPGTEAMPAQRQTQLACPHAPPRAGPLEIMDAEYAD